MANRFLGEGTVSANGKAYNLRFDMNVLADLEGRFPGRTAMQVLADLDGESPAIATVRQVCHAMLQRHHPDATIEDAGDILSEDMDALMGVVQSAMPQQDGGRGNGGAKAVQ
jgi:hypothetical protein